MNDCPANNGIETIVFSQVIPCGMSWDSESTGMNGLSLLMELHRNCLQHFLWKQYLSKTKNLVLEGNYMIDDPMKCMYVEAP